MKPPRQFLPLLKDALGFYRAGPLPLLAWLGIASAFWVFESFFSPVVWMEDHTQENGFGGGQIVSITILWVWLWVACSPALLELVHGLPASRMIEFLFTRAIDRKYFCRALVAAGAVTVQFPLILNLLLSPLKPELIFGPGVSTTPAAVAAQKRYVAAFPDSIRTTAGEPESSSLLIVRHGTVAFAAWLIWAETVAATLVGGYYALVLKRTQKAGLHYARSAWKRLPATMIVLAPMIIAVSLAVMVGLSGINLFEESFLRFAAHPWLLMALALAARYGVLLPALEWRTTQYEYL